MVQLLTGQIRLHWSKAEMSSSWTPFIYRTGVQTRLEMAERHPHALTASCRGVSSQVVYCILSHFHAQFHVVLAK